MRAIENCIDLPFGEVVNVHMGTGAYAAADSIVKKMRGTDEYNDIPGSSEQEKIAMMPQWICDKLNERAKNRLNEESTKEQMTMELNVLGLFWDEQEQLLRHSFGIQKKLDASDCEHLLCLGFTLDQHTKSRRNMSRTPNIHSLFSCARGSVHPAPTVPHIPFI